MTYPRKLPASLISKYLENGYWAGKTIYDFFVETEKSYPNDVAIRYKAESYTFSEFKRISVHLASSLAKLGIEKGDVVSVQLPNCPQFMFLQVALSMVGAIINPLHLVFRKRDSYSMLNFCEAKVLIIPASFGARDFVEEYADIGQGVPSIKKIIFVGTPQNGIIPKGYIRFDDLTLNNRGSETFVPRTVADDVFYLNFTSGTEGDPKGFLHTFDTLLTNAHRDPVWSHKECLMTMSPFTHTMGHLATYYCLMYGMKIVLLDKFEPGEAIKLIKAENVTVIQGTPAHLYGILDHESFAAANITSIHHVMPGAAQIPEDLVLRLRSSFKAAVTTGYGMGETICHTSTVKEDPHWAHLETVGRPCAGNEIKIFDPVLTPDNKAIGEIGYRGPGLFIEYFKNPARTDETRDDDGWFHTGDLGYVDEHGYLRITGRKKDVINRGGTKIYPSEVENLLKFHPKIRDVAVIGVADKKMGERSCACVIPTPGEAAITLEELQAFLKERSLTPYKWPEYLRIVEAFPMTPTGKVQKVELRKNIEMLIKEEQT